MSVYVEKKSSRWHFAGDSTFEIKAVVLLLKQADHSASLLLSTGHEDGRWGVLCASQKLPLVLWLLDPPGNANSTPSSSNLEGQFLHSTVIEVLTDSLVLKRSISGALP